MISQYNATEPYAIRNIAMIIPKRLTIRGFIVFDPDFGPKYFEEHQRVVGKWIAEGSFTPQIHVVDGIDNAAEGLIGMWKGDSFGKPVLKVSEMSDGATTKSTKGLVSGEKV